MSEHDRQNEVTTGSESDKKRKGGKKKMKYSQRWRQTTIANQILSASTALMTLATLFLFVAAGFQYCTSRDQLAVMREQTVVMRDEVNAASRAADAAKISADAANAAIEQNKDLVKSTQIQANVSERMAKQNEDLIKSADIQANTSQVSARAAQESAEASRDSIQVAIAAQRPRFKIDILKPDPFVFPANEILVVEFVITNTGQTPPSGPICPRISDMGHCLCLPMCNGWSHPN